MSHQTILKVVIVSFFLLIGSFSLGFAQQQTNSVVDSKNVSSGNSATTTVSTLTPSSDGLVSLDFQDADIKNVLKVLAYKSNINIVTGPEVTGTVTIQLNDVPWQKALGVVLSTYGYGYEKRGNIITVTTVENLKKRHEDAQLLADQEPLITKTYSLSFAKASDVVESINKMKTTRGQINFDQRTNTLIIRDVGSNMELIDEVIKTLDSATPQVLIEAKIIETDFSNAQNLGVSWNISAKASGSTTPTNFPFYPNIKSTFLNNGVGSTSTIASTSTSGVSSTGGAASAGITAAGTPSAAPAFNYGTLDASGLSVALNLLSSRSDTNILSSPSIVTLDNQTAKIKVGNQYPIPNYTYNPEQAKLQLSGFNYMDIGIIFEVTPHINNAGLVTLDLKPKVSAITDYVQVDPTSNVAKVPLLSNEEANTKVMIRDGQTLVIAGLVKENTQTNKNKVPFLGDLPLIGSAFRSKNDIKTKTELIIFLTPHIITADSEVASSKAVR
ncbi:MAG: type IV pilus secretin PilQ [Candidatus Omnitrophota bacterium]